MTVDKTEAKSGPFAALRRHYHRTRPDHRPVPKVLPLVVITILGAAAFFLLDARVAAMRGAWPAWIERPSLFLTDLGLSWWIISGAVAIIAIGALVSRFAAGEDRRRLGVGAIHVASYVLLSVALAGLISNVLKRAIGRPRPELFGDQGLFTFNPFMENGDFESFPSGHATTSGAFWTALALLFPPLRWPLLLVGAYLALTRVFVGAHYPSDVVVGFGWGMWFAFFMAILFARHGLVFAHAGGRLTRAG